MIDPNWWAGRRVAVTGHTGFVGSWLCLFLHELEAEVFGFGLTPPTRPNLFEEAQVLLGLRGQVVEDIRDRSKIEQFLDKTQPEVVFHLAAQPLVLRSFREPQLTWETNVVGTVNLLEAIRKASSVRIVQVFTSDKCYDNRGEGRPFRESDPLGGFDPYSASKAATELAVTAWRRSYWNDESNGSLATVRAGNIIGGGDWADDRLVPDCIRALQKRETITLRSPQAVRPWQHVLDCISAMLQLAQAQGLEPRRFSEAFNVGPANTEPVTVGQLVEQIQAVWSNSAPDVSSLKVISADKPEAHRLRLDTTKITERVGWNPRRTTVESVRDTVNWYRRRHEAGRQFDARNECLSAIRAQLESMSS